jgi:hypothetical protein
MREGSTLIPGMLPDTRDCILEQPLALPERSTWNTFQQMVLLVGITLGFEFFLERFAFLVFLMLTGTRFYRVNPSNYDEHSGDLLVTYVIYLGLVPFVFVPIAIGMLFYQAVLFTRHWVYLMSAAPCRPRVTLQTRSKLNTSLITAIVFFPLTAFWGAGCLFADPEQAWDAWKSYLNYGKGGVKAPGVFQSPAGSHRFRMHLFYCTGAAFSLSILQVPMPMLGMDAPLLPVLAALFFGPPTICLLVPLLILAPHFQTLRRIRREALV